ncbi:MAG: hypothetical protein ACR2LV_05485 [Solirubrobacteraceae bacterium]
MAIAGALLGAVDAGTVAVARADEPVRSCGITDAGGVNHVFTSAGVFGINPSDQCSSTAGGGLILNAPDNQVAHGQSAHWQANAPAGLQIVGFSAPSVIAGGVNDGEQYGGEFYWSTGGSPIQVNNNGYATAGLSSGYLGFDLVCEAAVCRGRGGNASIAVADIVLAVRETSGPHLSAGAGLEQAGGYVRGDWPLSFTGDSPSGLCLLGASVNGQTVGSQSFPANTTLFHQCSSTGLSTIVHTTQYAPGGNTLTLAGADAAQVPTSVAKTVYFDNQAPAVAVAASAADAPSSAGTQYVTATGTAGPSGVSGIGCTVDGAFVSLAGASARIPVSGIGVHTVTCAAANNARDTSGAVAVSSPASTTLSIRQPTVSGISFQRFVGLRCRTERVRVRVPGRLVTVRRHHKLVRVRRRAHSKTIRARRCHPRIEVRRVPFFVTIHGHRVKRYKRVKVIVHPHEAISSTRRVAFGQGTTVSGVLLASDGAPLAGQTVQVVTAANDGLGHFSLAATITTAGNGDWSARLPAGPSRLVEAVYQGGRLTEPSVSAQVRVVVPARVLLSVSPRRVASGGTVRIVGQLAGGYLPPGGALVRLRIDFAGARSTYGVATHVMGDGRFTTTYRFGAGVHRTFYFVVSSLPSGNYPFAPASSRRVAVLVGGCCHSHARRP